MILWSQAGAHAYGVSETVEADKALWRTAFLLSYWIFWGLLINAVVQGQIVDAF